MDPSKKIDYRQLMLSLIPQNGTNVGNVTLRQQLQAEAGKGGDTLTDDDYWRLRDELIDEGLIEHGRGRGGSVHLVPTKVEESENKEGQAPTATEPLTPALPTPVEADFYEPFHTAIKNGYVKENRIKRFVSEITAQQGRRATGGKWTRPDVTLIAVRSYKFTPGKRLEVITFEVKPSIDTALEGVYEALAHSAFAHRSYLAVPVSTFAEGQDIPDERIIQECTRHGVGYINFDNVADYDTYEIICPAVLKEPDPYNVDNFIKTQISAANQEQLDEDLK
jgi:hypothetical protein